MDGLSSSSNVYGRVRIRHLEDHGAKQSGITFMVAESNVRTNECLGTISAWVLAWGEGSKSFSSPVTSRNRSSNSASSGGSEIC